MRRQDEKRLKYGIIGLLVLVVIAFGKTIVNKISSGLAFNSAKTGNDNLVNETTTETGVRYTYVKGIIDAIYAEGEKPFYQDTDEKMIVSNINTLQSLEEVVFASNYFMQSTGKSLRAYLKGKLNSDWRANSWINPNAAGTTFSDLKTIVKNNLL